MKRPSKKKSSKRIIDHSGIRREILLEQLSNSEIARQYGVSRPLISRMRTKMKRDNALTSHAPVNQTVTKVRERVKDLLNRDVAGVESAQEVLEVTQNVTHHHTPVRRMPNPPLSQEEIESGAERIVQVVRDHRRDIQRGQELVRSLFKELTGNTLYNDCLLDIIKEVTLNNKDPRRRIMLEKAVSLSSRAATAKTLIQALKALIELERQAFGVDKFADDLTAKKRRITVVVNTGNMPEIKDDDAT